MKKIFTFFCAALLSVGMSRATEGTLPGAFSVGDDVQVHFSQGNLQYQASTQTWRFAENQWDMVGIGYYVHIDTENDSYISGTVQNGDNSAISSTYSGWIDLFGWGTGNNPTNTSTSTSDYGTFTDWGVNAIINGGNEANQWRTLTNDEWGYLFCRRTNAATLFGLGSVNGVNGTIILPDNWVTPQGASFTPSTTQGLANRGSYYLNSIGSNFVDNTYTAEQWSVME